QVTELKVELGRRGLSQTGLKFDLAQRLQTAMDVDEFGALPSLAGSLPPPSASSPLPQERTIKPSEELSSAGTLSMVVDALQSNDNAPSVAEDTPTFREILSSGERERCENGSKCDGSDQNMEVGILSTERALETCIEGGDANEIKSGKANEENVHSEERTMSGRKTVLPPSDYGDEKEDATAERDTVTTGAEDTPLLPPASTDVTRAPTSPQLGAECVAEETSHQTGGGAEDVDKDMTGRRNVLTSNELKDCGGANQRNDANQDGPSELPPDYSLLLCSQAERMKDREERFRRGKKPEQKKNIEESSIEDDLRSDGVDRAEADCDGHDRDGKFDSRFSGSSSVGGGENLSAGGDSFSEAPGAGVAEDARKTKLMKRKERFMVPPPAGNAPPSKNISRAEVEILSADCTASKVSAGTVVEEMSEPASSRRQMASEAAVKMARRAERFAMKQGGSRVPSVSESCVSVRDPRGSMFAESDSTSEGDTKKRQTASGATPGGCCVDPLPQRKSRAGASTAISRTNDEGALKRPRGCPDEGKEASEQSHGREKQHQASPSNAPPRGRGGGKGASFPSKGSHDVCRDDTAEKKAAEQAAKMAERRQRFAENPRAPSFR
ncbi:unnamed protein product, partial [Pylaiella littoralis]